MIDDALRVLGLDDKEQRFYLAALGRASSTVTELSMKAGVTRTHGYDLLERLASRGLLRTIAASGGQRVMAEDPEVLIARWETVKDSLEALVPHLRALSDDVVRPSVRLYEGATEIDRVVGVALKRRTDPLCLVVASTGLHAALSERRIVDLADNMRQRRGTCRFIAPGSMRAHFATMEEPGLSACVRFLQPALKLPVALILSGDHSLYVAPDAEGFALAVGSRELAIMNQTIFDLLWAFAPCEPGAASATAS